MKSHITMLELIKDLAMECGIRIRGDLFGLYVTDSEIRQVYARHAFNVAPGRKVHKRHIQNWQQIGEVYVHGDLETDDYAVFISAPEFVRMQMRRFSEMNGIPMECAICDVTWPALVEMGLISAGNLEVVQ